MPAGERAGKFRSRAWRPLLDLSNLPDADVVALAQRGREDAFRELVRRYERPVFSLIFRMVRDSATAEDLAQDTFIKVLNHIDKYRPEFKLSSWLFKIANNVAIDHLRRRQIATISMSGSPHAGTASEIEATSFDVASDDESALDEMESKELGSAIEKAIAQAPPRVPLLHPPAPRRRTEATRRSPRRSTCRSAR